MNNQPAFPLHNHGTQTLGMHFTGMTLLDYFAAKAMQGAFTNPIPSSDYELEYIAEKSYRMADAMMKARKICSNQS